MRIENWDGHEIRFREVYDDEWWADLGDVCKALELDTESVFPYLSEKGLVLVKEDPVWSLYDRCVLVNELGIYELFIISDKTDAQKFRRWVGTVIQKLRKTVGLHGYEIMRMTDSEVQREIDELLDTIYVDESTGIVMRSITVAGGDVEQIPFC